MGGYPMDFEYLNNMPGKKLLLKGNHDYWWTTLKKMREYLHENNFNNIDFLYNNSYEFENKIIVGTRGWQEGDIVKLFWIIGLIASLLALTFGVII